VSDIVPKRGEKAEDYWGLAAEASLAALDDAGLGIKDVDGVVFSMSGYAISHSAFTTNFCQHMGITPAWVETTPHGGHQMGSMLWRAAFGLMAGLASCVLIVATDNRQSRLSRAGVVNRIATQNMDTEFEYPFGPIFPSSMALLAQRHMFEFGTTSEQLAAVAVSNREWARLNPKAIMQEPLSIDGVLASRMITSPLHLFDICLVSDGGGAAVMVRADRARDTRTNPVYLRGFGDCAESQSITFINDFTNPPFLRKATNQAMKMAGIAHDDVDILYPYDPCTFQVIWGLEQMGFCELGQGGSFVAEGNIRPGGSLPCNTHGGLLSYCHPGISGGFLAIIEATRQLRGECGKRQVADARTAMTSAMGGYMIYGVNVLGTDRE
jgi:acetyl-CoA acetyltransferase